MADTNGLDTTRCDVNKLKQKFKLGDITWIKIRDSSWWPAQVADEKNVAFKLKKKPNDKVLVRLYGTYDYLYVDPEKSSSEFESIVQQQCNSIGEAFQKVLEEDVSRMKSTGNSKRKVSKSKENTTDETPTGKRQKQDKIIIDLEEYEDDPASPGLQIVKPMKAGDQEEKEKPRVKATGERKTKQDASRKCKVTGKAQNGASKGGNERSKGLKLEGKARDKASKDKSGKPKVTKMATGKQKELQVTENASNGVSKGESGKFKKARGNQKEKDEPKGKASKCGTPQQAPVLTARRVRVMQSLGLIAPPGSPFFKK